MDNLTHSLVGALLGQAGLKRKTGLAMPALIIGANLPDVDAACLLWLDGIQHVGFRRGITHGPPALVLLPLILAGLLWGFDRWQAKRGEGRFGRPEGRLPVHFGWLFALSFIGCLTHPAMDWLNVYGVRLLEPFSSQWFYGDVLFIIDVWLWGLMGFATWWSLRQEKRGGNWQRTARQALAIMLAYIGVNAAITAKAESDGAIFFPVADVIASPPPFAFWDRELIYHAEGAEPEVAEPLIGFWSVYGGLNGNLGHPNERVVFIESEDGPTPYAAQLANDDSQVAAFLFWSRAPFVDCSPEGQVLLRDARFYDPRARDRFSVALPNVQCGEPEPH